MDWIKIYKECEAIGGDTFKINETVDQDRFNTGGRLIVSTYPLEQIKVKAFDQLIKKFDGFSSNELRMIFEALRHPMNQCQDNKLLTEKIWDLFRLKESLE